MNRRRQTRVEKVMQHFARSSQTAPIVGAQSSDHLNLIRGLAAIAVLLAHIRWRLFVDPYDIAHLNPLQAAFYAITIFGRDAVMVFFVLSGFFISSSIVRDSHTGRWSFARYLTNRCVRLYVVLIPGLVLTALWDSLGVTYYPTNPVYTAAYESWRHNYVDVSSTLNAMALVGNVFFLQTIYVPPFWYYILFPCFWIALFYPSASALPRALYLVCGLAAMMLVTKDILLYFPIWLLGLLVGALPENRFIDRHRRVITALAVVGFVGILGLGHSSAFVAMLNGSLRLHDYIVGCTFAGLLYVLLHSRQPSAQGRYASISHTLANFSYTLYVAHLPLIVLLHAILIPGRPWMPDVPHLVLAFLIAAGMIGYGWVLSRLTEAHTDAIRKSLFSIWGRVTTPATRKSKHALPAVELQTVAK